MSQVVAPDDLAAAARTEAERYLSGSPFAIARTKRLVYESMAGERAAHLGRTRSALGANLFVYVDATDILKYAR